MKKVQKCLTCWTRANVKHSLLKNTKLTQTHLTASLGLPLVPNALVVPELLAKQQVLAVKRKN
jgi:hypothetical protein